MGLSVTGFYKL